MDERKAWRRSRSLILVTVLAFHVALLGLLVAASRYRNVAAPVEQPIEVTVLPPVKPPTAHTNNAHPQRLSTNVAIALAPPTLNSSSLSGQSFAPDGTGSVVNWSAEAHRALRAFEIRRDQFPSSAQSVSSRDEWWPRKHHAGDQFKTDSGDWIVWINSECYQVASSNAAANGANPPRTICPAPAAPPRTE